MAEAIKQGIANAGIFQVAVSVGIVALFVYAFFGKKTSKHQGESSSNSSSSNNTTGGE